MTALSRVRAALAAGDRMVAAPHSDAEYIATDPFFGDESSIKCRTVCIRKARKPRPCYGLTGKQDHTIRLGERYRYETAMIDDSFWGSYSICLPCMDKFIAGDF